MTKPMGIAEKGIAIIQILVGLCSFAVIVGFTIITVTFNDLKKIERANS